MNSRAGAAGRDTGMARAARNPRNAQAVDAAAQVLEVLIKRGRNFTSTDIILAVEAQGIYPERWQCIGGMLRRAVNQGRIRRARITACARPSRHCGNQAVWRPVEPTTEPRHNQLSLI